MIVESPQMAWRCVVWQESYVNARNGVDSKGGNLQNPAIKTTPYVLLFLNQSFFWNKIMAITIPPAPDNPAIIRYVNTFM